MLVSLPLSLARAVLAVTASFSANQILRLTWVAVVDLQHLVRVVSVAQGHLIQVVEGLLLQFIQGFVMRRIIDRAVKVLHCLLVPFTSLLEVLFAILYLAIVVHLELFHSLLQKLLLTSQSEEEGYDRSDRLVQCLHASRRHG